MPYLFQTFQEIIDDQTKECLTAKLKKETIQIIKTIDRNLFEIETQAHAEFYIQKVELALANFESTIRTTLKNNDSICKEKQLYDCLDSLDSIHHHIQSTYSIYRDIRKPVSKKTLKEISKGLQLKIDRLKNCFEKNKINEKLSNLIVSAIENVAYNKGVEVSQQKVEYITSFIDELIHFFDNLKDVNEQQLLHYLYMLNFNSVAMLCYICEHFKNMKEEAEDDKCLLDHLNQYKHKLISMPQSERPPYNVDLTDLKIQVQTWIQEEIVCVKKSIKRKAKEGIEKDGQKLKFNQSVDVITCLFRLLRDIEMTDLGANQTIKWIEQNISSKNQLHISRQSIQRKFYEKHPNKEPLKLLLAEMITHLNK